LFGNVSAQFDSRKLQCYFCHGVQIFNGVNVLIAIIICQCVKWTALNTRNLS